jgi:hypothetical protein
MHKTFIAKLSDSNISSHAVRRVTINVEVLKSAKIFVGEEVALCNADESMTEKAQSTIYPYFSAG